MNFVNEAQWGKRAYIRAKELSERNKKALYFTLVALFFTAFRTKDPSFFPLGSINYVASPEHSVNMKLTVSK